MMRTLVFASLLPITFSPFVLLAEVVESVNSLKIPTEKSRGWKNKKFEADQKITDLELKAQAGSLSRWSMKFDFGYFGPPVDNLSSANRPNPDNRPGDNRTSVSGLMGFRYRLSRDEGVTLGTGLRGYSPWQAAIGESVDRKGNPNYEVNNPQMSYDRTRADGSIQKRSRVGASLATSAFFVKRGQVGSVGYTESWKWLSKQSRWILGVSLSADYFFYSREYKRTDGRVSKYYLSLVPSIEYRLSDRVNFNTSFGYPQQNLRADRSWWRWDHQLSTWRVGAGWAITPVVYINPYINFFAEKPEVKTASFSFNTVFSIF